MFPQIEVKSNEIYTTDSFYNEMIKIPQVRDCGFAKVIVTDRESPVVTMESRMRKMLLKSKKLNITVPENSPRGIYRYEISSCPGKTLQEFYEMLEIEGTLPPDFPELPNFQESDEPSSSKMARKSTKSAKAKQRLIKKKALKRISNSSEKSNEKPQTSNKSAIWSTMPLFDINRSTMTPSQYIEAHWDSFHIDRPQRYAYEWDQTLFNDEMKKLNLRCLWNPIDLTFLTIARSKGVNRSMILVGGPDTAFPWHNEDLDLGSINYMHWGATKIWVIVNRNSTDKFRNALIRDFSSTEITPCNNPVKHKNYLTDIQWLKDNDIEYSIVTQEPGSYIILLPNIFHSGYNTGLCVNEAMNFMCPLWWNEYKKGYHCNCGRKLVEIDLSSFEHTGQMNLVLKMIPDDSGQDIEISKNDPILSGGYTDRQEVQNDNTIDLKQPGTSQIAIVNDKGEFELTNQEVDSIEEVENNYSFEENFSVQSNSNGENNNQQEKGDIIDNESIENTETDPLFIIDEPKLNANIDIIGMVEEEVIEDLNVILIPIEGEVIEEERNEIFITGRPERNAVGRPRDGQLICHICGFVAAQRCRLISHLDGHTDERKYECKWIDENGTVCNKKYKKQKELTEHKRTKKHRVESTVD